MANKIKLRKKTVVSKIPTVLLPDPNYGNVHFNVVGQMEVGNDGFVQVVLMTEDGKSQVMHLHRYPASANDKTHWAIWDCWVFPFANYPKRVMDEFKNKK